MFFKMKDNWRTKAVFIAYLLKKQKPYKFYACKVSYGCGGGTWTTRPSGYEPDELPTAPLRDIKICVRFVPF